MGGPELRVDENALNWDPAEVTVPTVPAVGPGGDPMSAMIAAVMPQVSVDVTVGVAETRARDERFSGNVAAARSAYQNTDAAEEQRLQSAGAQTDSAGAAGAGSAPAGSAAGQAGQLGQMMGMPMQMAAQAAQIPMQLAGMAAAIPQGIMQGVQSAMQQVGQLSGKTGAGDEKSAQNTDVANMATEPRPEQADEEPDQTKAESDDYARREDGAAPGGGASVQRAPESERPTEQQEGAPVPRPAPTRPAESPEIAL